VRLGENFQYRRLVLGIDADLDFWGAKGFNQSLKYSGAVPLPGTYRYSDKPSPDGFAVIGPRIGYAGDTWLPYIRVGTSIARGSHGSALYYTPTGAKIPTASFSGGRDFSSTGWVAGGGFDQCYNAQAAVAAGSLLVVATEVVQAPNDKNQVEPMLEKIGALPEELGETEHLLADTGYFSAGNVEACRKAGVEPVIAMGRQPHHPPLRERFEKAPDAPKDPTAVEAMAHKLKTPEGRALYALRKQTPEPVFGIIKSVLGFRQFSMRGLEKVRGEWSLVTMAWNLKRMFVLAPA
jgi:hypothetical protein